MISLLKKEIKVFFGSLIGYLIIGIFLLVNNIMLWSKYSDFNILDYGYANLEMFFFISPLLFLVFIPSIGMRVFSEEFNLGSIELLITKPISLFKIVFAKYLAVFIVAFLSIIPTLINVLTIYYLGENVGNLDLPAVFGSYIGLILLSSIFSAISIFASSLTSNQIIAFIIGILLCLLFYLGFDFIVDTNSFNNMDLIIKKLGISYHYNDMSKGLFRISDIVYFLSVSLLFLKFTENIIKNRFRK